MRLFERKFYYFRFLLKPHLFCWNRQNLKDLTVISFVKIAKSDAVSLVGLPTMITEGSAINNIDESLESFGDMSIDGLDVDTLVPESNK